MAVTTRNEEPNKVEQTLRDHEKMLQRLEERLKAVNVQHSQSFYELQSVMKGMALQQEKYF